MYRIYLIEDCNGFKYVGKTKESFSRRLAKHRYDKKTNTTCSSKLLDLNNCKMTCIDLTESKEESQELEEFYINSIDCVNTKKYYFDKKEWTKNYRKKNK